MASIFQSKEWEQFKLATGYQKSYWIEGILVLQKNLPFGRSMLYSPMVSEDQSSKLKDKNFLKEIREIANREKAFFYRFESTATTLDFKLSAFGFQKAFEEMQPEHTWILDLTQPTEKMLAGMKQKCRYNLKIAQNNNIKVEEENTADTFFELYSETAKRHGISFRSKKYFDQLLEILSKSGYARTYTAFGEIKDSPAPSNSPSGMGRIPLASAIIVYSGDTAIYMFGASSKEYKNMMAPNLLHFEIIQEAKANGFKKYDFFGIAPNDDPKHPWSGITRFKKQFGGEQVDLLGSHDLILRPMEYNLFKIAERIRRR
ncbi:MAG: peptidoglycan bridge formation glycyltransferase FemA/FemB family protein [Patescibacteria group bacterium]